MKKSFLILLVISVFASGAFAQKSDVTSDPRSLVEAEQAFASMSVAKGMREAFLENLADDAVLFHPGPVNGKQWWTGQPVKSGVLTWQPIFASVSRTGDMGYTTGPWEYREKSLEDNPAAFGNFVSIWKRQADGAWKVVLDLGTRNPQPLTPTPSMLYPRDYPTNTKANSKIDVEAERLALLKIESDFAKLVAARNTVDSFLTYFGDGVRLFRMKTFPVVGKEAARAALASTPGMLSWKTAKADVSNSGDLGYTYGTYEFKAGGESKVTESGNYMRIWRKHRDGKWRVVLDLLNPISPSPAS
jgi:ketosteroid isomerase-like protein